MNLAKPQILILLLLSLTFLQNARSQSYTQIYYENNVENIANPERGFYHAVSNIDVSTLIEFREQEKITIIYWNFPLDDFKAGTIPSWYLRNMTADFEVMRKAGVKAIVRFSYTKKATPPYGDAPINIVLHHIKQLKPILSANSDVILVLQAGFIGAWGEWYYTDYYSTSPGVISQEQWGWRRSIVDSLLGAISNKRMVQLRTPSFKKNILEQPEYTPVTRDIAFNETPISRIGHHNDCFVASYTDWGTYQDTAVEKPYLHEDTEFTMMGGETCNVCSYSDCGNTLHELERFHWTYLNIDYHTGVINDWIEQGCFNEIEKNLGYRYRFTTSNIQDETIPFGELNLTLNIVNDGWANPINPRDVELILKNTETSKEYFLPINSDPRLWPLNDTITLSIDCGIPQSMEEGNYQAFLNMPDAEYNLSSRPEYSIRTANLNTWDTASGYNSLLHTISINHNNQGSLYSGGNFLAPKNQQIPEDINIIIDGDYNDWAEIPILYSDHEQQVQFIKTYNTSDTLFVVVNGLFVHPEYQLYIDADNSTFTGYSSSLWAENGSDYLIENNQLYYYSGTNNEWDWTLIADLDFSQNDTVSEFKLGINQLSELSLETIYSIAYTNNYQNVQQASYLPILGLPFIEVNKNLLFNPPQAINGTTYSNNNIIYWVNSPEAEINTVIERSTNNGNYTKIFSANNNEVSFIDKLVDLDETYYYRAYYTNKNDQTSRSDIINKTANNTNNVFIEIKLDGNSDDWNICQPSATGYEDGISSVKYYNTADSLFFALEADSITNYCIEFGQYQNNNFNIRIQQDSVFKFLNSTWQFVKTIPSYSTNSFLESGLRLSDIITDSNDYFYGTAIINNINLSTGSEIIFRFLIYDILEYPDNFKLAPSVSDPYRKIKVKWAYDSKFEGLIIERSTNDSLHFERIIDLAPSYNYYLDPGLDSANTYYYRMFSYSGIIRSVYTKIEHMKPGSPSSINESINYVGENIQISPNPVRGTSKIIVKTLSPEYVTIELININSIKVRDIFKGSVNENKEILFSKKELPAGIYILKLTVRGQQFAKKLIIY